MSDTNLTKYWNSERTRKKQSALTRISNGLLNEVVNDRYTRELFEPSEIEAMKVAAEALSKTKTKLVHIKEKKARTEKRKQKELADIESQSKKYAMKVMDSFSSNENVFTREQLCLWVLVASKSRTILTPEVWELDINDHIDDHYLESDDLLRQRNVWAMRSKATQAIQDSLKRCWEFSFSDDKWVSKVEISQAAADIVNLKTSDEYASVERLYLRYLEPLEAFNRSLDAVDRRKNIKLV